MTFVILSFVCLFILPWLIFWTVSKKSALLSSSRSAEIRHQQTTRKYWLFFDVILICAGLGVLLILEKCVSWHQHSFSLICLMSVIGLSNGLISLILIGFHKEDPLYNVKKRFFWSLVLISVAFGISEVCSMTGLFSLRWIGILSASTAIFLLVRNLITAGAASP